MAWRRRASTADALRRLVHLYADAVPQRLRKPEWVIGYRYPPPIGSVRFLLRANHGSDAFIHSEIFEHEYYRLPLSAPPMTILDLGANIGLATIYFSRLYPSAKIACVEPEYGNLRVLKHNLALNGIAADVFAVAVDCEDGKATMQRHPQDYGHKLVDGRAGDCHFDVDALSVSTLMQRLDWRTIGLLKVDIEGHESKLLTRNCEWLRQVEALCVEWHDPDTLPRLKELAQQYGFAEPAMLRGIWFLRRPG
jgi:FkbM family methyltransferase